jgi:hypothetical protein
MKVIYTRKTSDGQTVEIWEDGLITARLGYPIPGIGKKKLRTGYLAVFSEEIHLFSMAELWALYGAAKSLSEGGEPVKPVVLRKTALDFLAQHTASYRERLAAILEKS